MVARRRGGLRRRAGGLLQRPLARRPGTAAREPPTARRSSPRRRAARRDRHPRHPHRPDARLPERCRHRRARRPAPARRVVPRRQVAGAGRPRDRCGDERRHDVVVGVGDVQRGRPRPRQARRRVRLSLGAERPALQRAGEARGGLQRVTRRRPAPTAGHRDVQDRCEHDRHERDREAEPRRAGPRRRLQRAARAARRDVRRQGDRAGDPRCRARGDRAALRRQPLVVRRGAREVARVRRGRPQRPRRPAPAAQARGEAARVRPERREHRRVLLLVSRAARAQGRSCAVALVARGSAHRARDLLVLSRPAVPGAGRSARERVDARGLVRDPTAGSLAPARLGLHLGAPPDDHGRAEAARAPGSGGTLAHRPAVGAAERRHVPPRRPARSRR